MKRKRETTAAVNGSRAFLVGGAAGLVITGTVYSIYFFGFASAYSDQVLSGIDLLALGLALGGYLSHWKGDRSFPTYFLFGLGVGMILVAFIGAGGGVTPLIGS